MLAAATGAAASGSLDGAVNAANAHCNSSAVEVPDTSAFLDAATADARLEFPDGRSLLCHSQVSDSGRWPLAVAAAAVARVARVRV